MFEFEADLEALDEDDRPAFKGMPSPPELDLYETHQEQQTWLKKSGSYTPIPPPLRVKVIDDSCSPKRTFRPTLDEMKNFKASGLWVVRSEGFEDGEWTVHVNTVRGRR